VLGGAAVAATEAVGRLGATAFTLVAAALALTSAREAQADSAPDRGAVSVKYLDYLDSQPGADRVQIRAPAVSLLLPLSDQWSFSGTYVADAISGASPAYHTRRLTRLTDHRNAVDGAVTRYFPRGTLSVGASYSKEHDYTSRGLSAQGTLSTEDKNTTFLLGSSFLYDDVYPSYGGFRATKHSSDFIAGVTQVLSKRDIVQANLRYSSVTGYLSDPYKFEDARPDARDIRSVLARWNHQFSAMDGITHLTYRYLWDSWGVRSHTLGLEYVQSLGESWSVTPSVRYYSQTGASFYVATDPLSDNPVPPPAGATYYSEDRRLSTFGAVTLGIKVAKRVDRDWIADVKFEQYEQRGDWALAGKVDSGLATFRARSVLLGLTRFF